MLLNWATNKDPIVIPCHAFYASRNAIIFLILKRWVFLFLFVCANNIKPFIRFLIERTHCWCWCWVVAMLLYCMLYFCVLFRLIYGILFISNFPYLMLLFRCFMPLSHRALVTNRNSYISENFFENAIFTLKTNGFEIFFWREARSQRRYHKSNENWHTWPFYEFTKLSKNWQLRLFKLDTPI